jgi:long-chain acyl-CoA synthetase
MAVSNQPEPWRTRYAHPGAWDAEFPPLSMPEMFAASAGEHAAQPLVEFFGRRFSYAQVAAEARAFAAGLQAIGIGKGDRVGIFLPNVPIYVSAYYGALIAGAVVVNFSPLYTAAELEAQVVDSGARVLVTIDAAALMPTALAVLDNSPLETLVVGSLASMMPWAKGLALRIARRKSLARVPKRVGAMLWSDALRPGMQPRPVPVDPLRDLALLQYTGGTTGPPKGAMLTHQNLTANARQVEAIDPNRGGRDVIMGVLPLFHVFAMTCVMNRTVANGGCMALLPRFDAGQALRTLGRVKATAMPGVPTMYQALLDHPDLAKTDFSSLRVCISGGAPLPDPVHEAFMARTGARLAEGYGLTESAGVVATNPYEGPMQSGTIGQPIPATRLRLLDKEDPAKDAPPGEPGELAVQGPQIMAGYWNRPAADADAFVKRADGRWLRTGDVATIDAEGWVRIVDRLKDMIAVGGFKVFPSQLEDALLTHPAVREALVIGVPDTYRGEVPRAYVTLRMSAEGDALRD